MTSMMLSHINRVNDTANQKREITEVFDTDNNISVSGNNYSVVINEERGEFEVTRDGWQDKNAVACFFIAIMDLFDRGFSAETRTEQLTAYLNNNFKACINSDDPEVLTILALIPRRHIVAPQKESLSLSISNGAYPSITTLETAEAVLPTPLLSDTTHFRERLLSQVDDSLLRESIESDRALTQEPMEHNEVQPQVNEPLISARFTYVSERLFETDSGRIPELKIDIPEGLDHKLMGCSIKEYCDVIKGILDPNNQRELAIDVTSKTNRKIEISVHDHANPDFTMRIDATHVPEKGGVMHIGYIKLIEQNQGQGIMSKIINNTLQSCPKVNVINFTAGDAVGPYAWPKYGAVPTDIPVVMAKMQPLALAFAEQKIRDQVYSEWRENHGAAYLNSAATSNNSVMALFGADLYELVGFRQALVENNLELIDFMLEEKAYMHFEEQFRDEYRLQYGEVVNGMSVQELESKYGSSVMTNYEDEIYEYLKELKLELPQLFTAIESGEQAEIWAVLDQEIAKLEAKVTQEFAPMKAKLEQLASHHSTENFWALVDEDMTISAQNYHNVLLRMRNGIVKQSMPDIDDSVLKHDGIASSKGTGHIKLGKLAVLSAGNYEASMPLRDLNGRKTATADRMINYTQRNMNFLQRQVANNALNKLFTA
ncbi:hypothetical protein [Shewanella surugensis]|uniref:N-acetyltransferase domain-containing protein n=1 Tax=Shewanella surugensis TaxID=212020 RepID=A0ABT0L6R9_9GAMM|nr:hypothetical protein [Shewanella surugensis]MCL1123365.1 hypothetical protein [Shewanella surugensis]